MAEDRNDKITQLQNLLQGSLSTPIEDKKVLLEQNIGLKFDSTKSAEVIDEVILVFQEAIRGMIQSGNNLQVELLQFIQQHHKWVAELPLPDLIKLRNHFNHSLESVMFFIICLEFSKTFEALVFREFTAFLSDIFFSKNLQQVSIEEFRQFRLDWWSVYKNGFFEKYPNQREKVLKMHREELEEDLFRAHKKLLDILKVNFETSRELTLFAQVLSLNKVDEMDSKLSFAQKEEAKISAQKLTHGGYDKVTKLVNYLKFAYATENDMMAFQTDENIQIFKEKVLFYLQANQTKAFDFLEQMKSSIFLKQLAFQIQWTRENSNGLVEQLLQKEQQVQREIAAIFQKKQLGSFPEMADLAAKRNVLTEIYGQLEEIDTHFAAKYQAIRSGNALRFNELKSYL